MALKRFALRRLWLPRRVRLRWRGELDEANFQKRLAVARETGDAEARQRLLHERAANKYFDHEEAESAFTEEIVARARELRAPIPEYPAPGQENEWWVFSNSLGERYLTAKGIAETRDAIRKEERWQHERRRHLITLLTATTGVIGTVIGLVAILGRS